MVGKSMTPDELRKLADEWDTYPVMLKLAPALARLCAEQHEALKVILSPWDGAIHPSIQKALAPARATFAKFAELEIK